MTKEQKAKLEEALHAELKVWKLSEAFFGEVFIKRIIELIEKVLNGN